MFCSIKKLLNDKLYISILIFVLVCGYGFTMTHLSIGIDDFSIDYYLTADSTQYGNLIQQGRLAHFIFYYIGITDVIPLITTFLSTAILFFSCLSLSVLVQRYSDNYFKSIELAIFSSIYATFPIIVFKYIYELDLFVFMLSFLLIPISIYLIDDYFENKKIYNIIFGAMLIMMSIASYESFAAVFIVELLMLYSLRMVVVSDKSNNRIIKELFVSALIFIFSFLAYKFLVKIIQEITLNPQYVRANLFSKGINKETFKDILYNLKLKFLNFRFLFNVQIILATLFVSVISILYSLKKKNLLIFLLFVSTLFFNYFIILMQTSYYFRTAQTFVVFFSFSTLFLMVLARNNYIYVFLMLVIFFQVKDMNRWFYQDYITFDKNKYTANEIMKDIATKYDLTKYPVSFVNRNYDSPLLMNWDKDQGEIGESALVSSSLFLGDYTSRATHKFFEYCGYRELNVPTLEQAKFAYEYSDKMPYYPQEGYFELVNNIIIVNLGEKK